MGEAIGQVLALAAAVALSPIPIIGVSLMLGTARARSNGPAFLLGWLVGLAGVGTIALLISGGADASEHGRPADWVSALKLVLGIALLLVAARQWRSRHEAKAPRWMRDVESFTAVRAGAFGVILSALNPKNLVLILAAAAAIAQTGAAAAEQAAALAVFVVIGTLGVAVPVTLYFLMGERSERMLEDLKGWMGRNNAAIVSTLCLVIAAKLIGDAITGFAG